MSAGGAVLAHLSNIHSNNASLDSNPEQSKPLAVSVAVENRHGIILFKEQLDKKTGVKSGEPILCDAMHNKGK